ncbi:hypothetical protein CSB62_22735 [Vibrio splendidus]|nr:hypothetical protein CSB62_22735 [Vibrio splendidus]PME57183.1 hypothetical protein BCV33_10505 [Vibrio lentus]PMG62763.1 hypothetical protein BCU87_11750 [Vibrio lentus]PMJ07505.1 hypothetical protein BCU31_23700 [Vibrio lentus]PML07761.1 hypothetical protein BCT85_20800 [Vibrio lentus]
MHPPDYQTNTNHDKKSNHQARKITLYYVLLLAAGKPKKAVIIAYVRKVIVSLSTMLNDGTMWGRSTTKNWSLML